MEYMMIYRAKEKTAPPTEQEMARMGAFIEEVAKMVEQAELAVRNQPNSDEGRIKIMELAFAIYPIAVAQQIDQLHRDEILSGSSSLLLVNGLGSVGGPLLAGLLMQQFGPQALPLYFAGTLGLLAAYTLYRLRHVSDLVSEPAGHFMPMLRTSHTVLELMPDAPPTDEQDNPDLKPLTESP